MASAPPMESVGPPQPPSYEEAMARPYPQQPYGFVPLTTAPPGFDKPVEAPYPQQQYGTVAASPVVHTVYVQQSAALADRPQQVHCPRCMQLVITRLEHNAGAMAWLTCAGLSIFGCIYGCCLIPFCVDDLKDVTHHCPQCNSVLGVYKRL